MAGHYEYQVVIHVLEDDEWEDQELVSGNTWLTPGEADEEKDGLDLSRYPKGTYAYVEFRSHTDWKRL